MVELKNQYDSQETIKGWLERKGFSLSHAISINKVMNAFQITMPGYALPVIASHPSVATISLASVPWEVSRTFVRRIWFGENEIPPEQNYPYTGKGVRVGIIDTGLDIGDEFYGRDIKGMNFADPDAGWNDLQIHGTALAGIIGGNGSAWYQKGIAPNVSLRIYKVFSSNDYRPLGIVPAIEQALTDQCDVLNVSLNGLDNPLFQGEEVLVEKAIQSARNAGMIVVVPTGNLTTVQQPGTFSDALTVGSADDRSKIMMKVSYSDSTYLIKGYNGYLSLPFTKKLDGLPVVYAGYGRINDFDQINVKNKIVLLDRGPLKEPITFYEKITRATEMGAKAVLLVNLESYSMINPIINLDFINTNQGEPTIFDNPYNEVSEKFRSKPYHQMVPVAMITYEDGRWMKAHSEELSITFDEAPYLAFGQYLSKGNDREKPIKPDFIAPGEMVIAPIQKKSEDKRSYYVAMSGSSASTAFASGSIALVKEAHPDWKQDQISLALKNTAQLLRNPVSNQPYGVLYQGAGMIQPDQAIRTETSIEPALIYYNARSNTPIDLQISNRSMKSIDLPISVEASLEVNEWNQLIQKQLPEKITLQAGEKKIIRITIPDTIVTTMDFWIHTGEVHTAIHIQSDRQAGPTRPITRFSVSQTKLKSPLKNLISIYFTLQECSLISSAVKTYHWETGLVSVKLLNQYKRVVSVLFSDVRAHLGENTLYWDGFASRYPLHISEGNYFFEITLYRYQVTPQQASKMIVSDQAWTEVLVIESEKASNYLCLRCPQKNDLEAPIELGINFSQPMQFKQLELELTFNPQVLLFQDLKLTPPWVNHPKIALETQCSNEKGWLLVRIAGKDKQTLSLSPFQTLLSATMIPDQLGIATIHVSKIRILSDDEKPIPVLSLPSLIEIKDTPFLLADLNHDNRVNSEDEAIWRPYFGTSIGNSQYDKLFDLDQNGRVGPGDLMWMAKEWETEIQP